MKKLLMALLLYPTISTAESLSEEACFAYADYEEFFAALDTSEFEDFLATEGTVPEAERMEFMLQHGVAKESVDFIQSANENKATGTGILLGALMHKHHPDIFTKAMKNGDAGDNPAVEEFDNQIVAGILQTTLDGYDEQCLR